MLLLDRLLCFENNHMYTERMVQEFWLPHGELHEKMYFGLCLGNFPTVGDLIFARYCLGIQKERWQKDSSTKSLCERQPGLHAAHCRQRCRFNLLDIFGVKGCILERSQNGSGAPLCCFWTSGSSALLLKARRERSSVAELFLRLCFRSWE